MIKKDQIERVLRINGISAAAPDEEIRSVLMSARFNKDEVDTAIMVLREDVTTKKTRVDGLHKVFRTDDGLLPEEISHLLGIEVDAKSFYKPEPAEVSTMNGIQYITVWLFSVFFAVVAILMYMYTNDVGPFHPTVETARAAAKAATN